MKITKTRFAPSPTGSLHIGGARTALYNYLLARKFGGKFLLRIEDTDAARHCEESVDQIARDLKWLGIEWDEGYGAGGDAGPYRQSQRLDIYAKYIDELLDSGKAYYAFDTRDELDAMREAAREAKRDFRYTRPAQLPGREEAVKARSEGRPAVIRFLAPDRDVTIYDSIFGDVTIGADQIDDFVIVKDDGNPIYHLANVIDDGLMGIDFICRGQEFLGQTWRQALLREALGFPEPGYAHLPLIMDMQGKKLSKRDGDVEVDQFLQSGYMPEPLVNFMALLGWHPDGEREKYTIDELVENFGVSEIGKSNAKFDRDKLIAFNRDASAEVDSGKLLESFKVYLSVADTPIPRVDDDMLAKLLELSSGFRTFEDVVVKCGAMFIPNNAIEYQPKAVKKVLKKGDGAGLAVLRDIRGKLEQLDWDVAVLEAWMKDYCETNEVGMGKVAQPVRVAVTGGTVSPSLMDTLVIIGKENTLARIDKCIEEIGAPE